MKMRTIFSLFILLIVSFSCSEMNLDLPSGPEGKSAYELWVDGVTNGQIEWSKDKTQIEHFYLYMKGQDGKSGLSAYELWIKEVEKGIKDPHNPGQNWNKNKTELNDFWYFLTGADGKNGSTPQIGENGNWWIDGEDTGIPAKGKDGQDGDDGKDGESGGTGQDGEDGRVPEVTIGNNGNWHIDGKDTGKPAFGEDGKAAYELWKEEVANGLKNPHDEDGGDWPKDKTSVQDFWEYLSGKDGKDGEDCDCCDPCHPDCGDCEEPILGMANVLAMWNMPELDTGEIIYTVYNDAGEYAPFAKVKGMPGMDPEKEFTADEYGDFIIYNKDLPEGRAKEDLKGSATVTYKKAIEGGTLVTEQSAANTYVPNRIKTRVVITEIPRNFDLATEFLVKVELNEGFPNSKWESISRHYHGIEIEGRTFKLSDKNDPTSYDITDPFDSFTISGDPFSPDIISIPRYIVRAPYLKSGFQLEHEWTPAYSDPYYILHCGYIYGEELIAPMVIKGSTQQFMPLFNKMTMSGEFSNAGSLIKNKEIKVTFDINQIKPEHLFKTQYVVDESMSKSVNGIKYTYYVPELGDDFYTKYKTNFIIRISHQNDHSMGSAKLSAPEAKLDDVIIFDEEGEMVKVYLSSDNSGSVLGPHLISQGYHEYIGDLIFDKATNKLEFKGKKDSEYDIPDINVTQH